MAARLTKLGKMTKWVLIPAAVASLGYFIVGPRLGADPAMRKRIREIRAGKFPLVTPDSKPGTEASKPESESADEDDSSGKANGPEIEIDTRRAMQPGDVARGSVGEKSEETRRPRRRRRRSVTKPAETTAAPKPAESTPSTESTSYSQGATRETTP